MGAGEDEDPGELPASEFAEGDKVLAYHGPRIYEAKIQKTEYRKNEWQYFVHYLGWSKNWDEWIGKERVLPFTKDNLEKQKELEHTQSAERRSKGRMSQSKQKGSTGSRGKKRKSEEKDGEETEPAIKLTFPAPLRKQLIDECDAITQAGKLLKLPRNPNVEETLRRYQDSRHDVESTEEVNKAVLIVNAIRDYFDKALPRLLLYKEERRQHDEVFSGNLTLLPCRVYGAEHLLRLFVKLPELLNSIKMEEEAILHLQHRLMDILRFMQKHQSTLFIAA